LQSADHILGRRLDRASQFVPYLASSPLHEAHGDSIRRSTAIALLKPGVDLSTISHYLGHASPTTTNHYAKVDLEMKRKAIARVKPVAHQSHTPWSKNPTILDWLESL
jgi:integrase